MCVDVLHWRFLASWPSPWSGLFKKDNPNILCVHKHKEHHKTAQHITTQTQTPSRSPPLTYTHPDSEGPRPLRVPAFMALTQSMHFHTWGPEGFLVTVSI